MAKQEELREDLIAEATALVDRIEFQVPDRAGVIVAGFRRQVGAVSTYFDQDPAFHFNSTGELRRAYCDGNVIKAENRRLISLSKIRDNGGLSLVRHEMSPSEQRRFLDDLQIRLAALQVAVASQEFEVLRSVSGTGKNVMARFADWLDERPRAVFVAATAHVC